VIDRTTGVVAGVVPVGSALADTWRVEVRLDDGGYVTCLFTPERSAARRSFMRAADLPLTVSPTSAMGRVVRMEIAERPVTGSKTGKVVPRVLRWHRPRSEEKKNPR
jgi:hypothetical protein